MTFPECCGKCGKSLVFPFLVLFMLYILPALTGTRWYVVTSGSMSPAIPTGSMVVVCRSSFGEIRAGDVITFRIGGGDTTVTHRVTSVDRESSCLRTKGDANEHEDAAVVREDQIVGVVRLVLPFPGVPGHP